MNSAAPTPGSQPRVDPESITAEVDAALQAVDADPDTAAQLQVLESLHQRLSAALNAIDPK